MTPASPSLSIAAAPHVHAGSSVSRLMLHGVIALLPVTAFAVVVFGLAALATILVAILSCLLVDRLCGGSARPDDGSVLLTGLLLGLSLPPALPLWMVAVGGAVAILVGRQLFGGLGGYAFHPVLVGRVFLQAAFPIAMAQGLVQPFAAGRANSLPDSTLALPFMAASGHDAFSGATPLAAARSGAEPAAWLDLLLGNVAGAVGETSALLLLLGGLYLVAQRVVDWRIPVALLAGVAVLSAILHGIDPARHPDVLAALCSGGLMLGAWFLATDPVSSPLSRSGKWLYGLQIGLLVVLIRQYSGHAEGVMYAILLGNALTPHIDRWTRPRPLRGKP